MRVMTFNIRFENDRDGANGWEFRRTQVINLIRSYSPWILGTQEGVPNQLRFLVEQLPGYQMYGVGRPVEDDTCQYPTLYYRPELLEFVEGGEFWLSKNPQVHRSKDWDSAFPRMISYALFRDRKSRKCVWVAVTHLDHVGEVARVRQGEIISQWIENCPGAKILMGDFNDLPGSAVHQLLTQLPTQLCDTWETLGQGEDCRSMTHHDFQGNPNKGRLDWILVSPHFRVQTAGIAHDQRDGRFPSDHFPYWVDLEWV